jgi:hypothetical protein
VSSNFTRPKWWQLYLTFPLLIALFTEDNRLKLSARGHQVLQIGIVLLVYGFVHLWLKTNETALSKMDQRQFDGTVIVTRASQYQLPDIFDERPIIQSSKPETKVILSDTFEMDCIDAEYISIDEVL